MESLPPDSFVTRTNCRRRPLDRGRRAAGLMAPFETRTVPGMSSTTGWVPEWRANFFAGLAVALPLVISLAIVKWLFGTLANLTDVLLFWLRYLPLDPAWVYQDGVKGEMLLGWQVVAIVLAVCLVALIGRLARHHAGKMLLRAGERALLKVPLLNTLYGAVKQVHDAFATSKSTAFQTVVMIEFPREGLYSIGFITSDQNAEVQARTKERVISVFVPTTPNPTTGFLVMVPEDKVTRLDMSVADGIKFIISLGSVSPPHPSQLPQAPAGP